MLGLFLILPVFALYARELQGHSAFLVGVALGIYGLTQAALQIPLGILSDRVGRKPVIVGGLLVFCLGSMIAASADSLGGVIVGRALQGAGAIAAAVMAMLADLTRDEQRTKAMLALGITIGGSFVASLLLGPVLDRAIGVRGIFWLTAVLALMAMALVLAAVPTPVRRAHHLDTQPIPAKFMDVLHDKDLLRLDLGILVLHGVLTALFVVIPIALLEHGGLPLHQHWRVYLPAMLLSLLIVFPAISVGERKRRVRHILLGAGLILLLSQGLLFQAHQSLTELSIALFLFFVGFNTLEGMLPSLVSKIARVDSKGTAMGVYSTFEFLGVFIGGAAGGWLHGRYGISGVFSFSAILLLLWLVAAWGMREPQKVTTRLVHVGRQRSGRAQELAAALEAVRGVTEATVIPEEGVAYVKVVAEGLDEESLQSFDLK